ncbi:MAG: primosomal protein N' (replication factor Y), partial [Saprospiraceae bacterium]
MNTDKKQIIYHVAVSSPLRRLFDYLSPETSHKAPEDRILQPGIRVTVPFGHRKIVGIIVARSKDSSLPLSRLKPIANIIDTEPLIPEYLFKIYIWATRYYQHPIGDGLFRSLPSLLRKGKDLPNEKIQRWRLTEKGEKLTPEKLTKTPKQQEVFSLIKYELTINKHDVGRLKISPSILRQLKE